MKKIIINNVEYYYWIDDEFGDTWFHIKEEYIGKKYYFFGKKITKTRYISKFSIPLDIESPYNSKEVINLAIQRVLAILKRKEEIQRGEII